MNEINTIVVPVDLERHTAKLVAFSIYMAQKLSASLTFIHVVEHVITGDMMLGSPTTEPLTEERMRRAQELIANIIEDNHAVHSESTGTVVRGEVVAEIVTFAKDKDAGMIIIGTRGTKGLEKILQGSVAERVVKRAHCPTLVMNPYK